jgi:hypothetical protein
MGTAGAAQLPSCNIPASRDCRAPRRAANNKAAAFDPEEGTSHLAALDCAGYLAALFGMNDGMAQNETYSGLVFDGVPGPDVSGG